MLPFVVNKDYQKHSSASINTNKAKTSTKSITITFSVFLFSTFLVNFLANLSQILSVR